MIAQQDGIWWPEGEISGRHVIIRDVDEAVRKLLTHVPGRELIIQAGANVGVYPLALADHFQRVVTAEPDPVNFDCLSRNLDARDSLNRVVPFQVAFGECVDSCKVIEVSTGNCGAHRIELGGTIPVLNIDALAFTACDAIWLDIEGSELAALKGALKTIETFSPVICVEDKGLGAQFFNTPPNALQEFLAGLGYQEVDRIGLDKVFRRQP